MKRSSLVILLVAALLCLAIGAVAQVPSGKLIAPPSTLNRIPGQVHTPLYIFIPDKNVNPLVGNGETPASLACIYGLVPPTSGCPKNGTVLPTGGTKAIAVVEYGDYSAIQSDLNTFDTQFGITGNSTLMKMCYPGPSCPANNGTGWDLEEALDVEYAHALAPNAQIIVVSFTNDPLGDGAEQGAAQYIANTYGHGEISNSWTYNGGENWCGSGNCELQYDNDFAQPGIVYFGAAGDSGLGPAYPSISPNVVSAGGTDINRDSNGNFTNESCWSGSGGGISIYEPLPQYQLWVENKTGSKRGTPDLAAIAGAQGVEIYSSTYCGGFCQVDGTSIATPVLASIVNQAGNFRNNTLLELSPAYQNILNPVYYHTRLFDVTTGSNGSPAGPGWDECTGLGSIRKPQYF